MTVSRLHARARSAILVAACFLAACNDDQGPGGPAGAVAIAAHAGATQTVLAGTAVTERPAVEVTDASGNGVANVSVTFAVASGGGSVTGETQTTDADGIAVVGSWTLGTAVGVNTLRATAEGLTGSPVVFVATGRAGAPAAVVIQAGDNQTALARGAVPVRPAVKVTDANGNALSSVVVTFAVTSGGGTVTSASPTTDASGVASVGSWVIGVGSNTLVASVANVAATVSFSATGTIGPPARIVVRSGNSQSAVAGTQLPTRPTVGVVDANGNGVASVTVQFAVATGGGSITGASQTTDGSGDATLGSWTLGTTAGANTVAATAPATSATAATITATGTSGPASQLAIQAGDNQSAPSGNRVTVNPAVKVTDANGNGVAGVGVTFAVASGGGTITGSTVSTGSNGVATVGSWVLGTTAGTNTLTASVAGVASSPVTFTATGVAASLVGLFNASPGVWQFVRVNSETGAQTLIAAVANLTSVQDGESVLDATTLRYYFIGTDNTSTKRLYTLNATTGAVIASPALSFADVLNIEFDLGTRQVIGLARLAGVLQFVRIDPATGNVSFVAAVTGLSAVQSGDATSDPPNSRYHFIGFDASGIRRLYTLSTQAFSIVFQPTVDRDLTSIQLDTRTGLVVGMSTTAGAVDFVRVEPQFGTVATFGTVSGLTATENNATIVPSNFRYVITGSDPAHRLLNLDPLRGTVLVRPAVAAVVLLQGLP
jgi:hypothetical protein